MIGRTLYRPREIIQFSTQVIECAQYGQAGLTARTRIWRRGDTIVM